MTDFLDTSEKESQPIIPCAVIADGLKVIGVGLAIRLKAVFHMAPLAFPQ